MKTSNDGGHETDDFSFVSSEEQQQPGRPLQIRSISAVKPSSSSSTKKQKNLKQKKRTKATPIVPGRAVLEAVGSGKAEATKKRPARDDDNKSPSTTQKKQRSSSRSTRTAGTSVLETVHQQSPALRRNSSKSGSRSSTNKKKAAATTASSKTKKSAPSGDDSETETETEDGDSVSQPQRRRSTASRSVGRKKRPRNDATAAIDVDADDEQDGGSDSDSELEVPYAQNLGVASNAVRELGLTDSSAKEPLRPGDVIRYTAPMAVAGSTGSLRVAQVLKTQPGKDIPLTLDNGEFLTLDMCISRIKEYKDGALLDHPGIARPLENFRMKKAALDKAAAADATGLKKQVDRIRKILTSAKEDLETFHERQSGDSTTDDSKKNDDESSESELDVPYTQALGVASNAVRELGLTENSVKKEPLRPGDVIRYTAPMAVAGSIGSLRVAQVLRTNPGQAIPLNLDTGEFLTLDTCVSRVKEYKYGALLDHPGISRPLENFRMKKAALNKAAAADSTGLQQQVKRIRQILTKTKEDIETLPQRLPPPDSDDESSDDEQRSAKAVKTAKKQKASKSSDKKSSQNNSTRDDEQSSDSASIVNRASTGKQRNRRASKNSTVFSDTSSDSEDDEEPSKVPVHASRPPAKKKPLTRKEKKQLSEDAAAAKLRLHSSLVEQRTASVLGPDDTSSDDSDGDASTQHSKGRSSPANTSTKAAKNSSRPTSRGTTNGLSLSKQNSRPSSSRKGKSAASASSAASGPPSSARTSSTTGTSGRRIVSRSEEPTGPAAKENCKKNPTSAGSSTNTPLDLCSSDEDDDDDIPPSGLNLNGPKPKRRQPQQMNDRRARSTTAYNVKTPRGQLAERLQQGQKRQKTSFQSVLSRNSINASGASSNAYQPDPSNLSDSSSSSSGTFRPKKGKATASAPGTAATNKKKPESAFGQEKLDAVVDYGDDSEDDEENAHNAFGFHSKHNRPKPKVPSKRKEPEPSPPEDIDDDIVSSQNSSSNGKSNSQLPRTLRQADSAVSSNMKLTLERNDRYLPSYDPLFDGSD